MFLASQILQSVFEFANHGFRLDGNDFVIRAGEIHPSRVPYQYWQHRIQMAKAMGMNTISMYIFWNVHEKVEGQFNFEGQNNMSHFISLVQQEQMYVILRPGPYVCSEFDFGGIPTYLLKDENMKIRTTMDANYTAAAKRYFEQIIVHLNSSFIYNGGCILMMQAENEYSSWTDFDENYLTWVQKTVNDAGYRGKLYTADPLRKFNQSFVLKGGAIGINGGFTMEQYNKFIPSIPGENPVFVSEFYPGWFGQWGDDHYFYEKDISDELKRYYENNISFSIYVIHGGTNFGKFAGAYGEEPEEYTPITTSYDFGAPISEYGVQNPLYQQYRKLAIQYLGAENVAKIPQKVADLIEVDKIQLKKIASLMTQDFIQYENITEDPQWFEIFGQDQGIIVYSTNLTSSGDLVFEFLHDYAHFYINGRYLKTYSRSEDIESVNVNETGLLEVMVVGNGHKCYTKAMSSDRKGLFGKVQIGGTFVKNWSHKALTFENIQYVIKEEKDNSKGSIFKGTFQVDKVGDTFISYNQLERGFIFINNHSLGNFMSIGPQKRLYCPGSFLKLGLNDIIIVDFTLNESESIIVDAEDAPLECVKNQHLQGTICVQDDDDDDDKDNTTLIICLSVCIPLAIIIGAIATILIIRCLKKKSEKVPYHVV